MPLSSKSIGISSVGAVFLLPVLFPELAGISYVGGTVGSFAAGAGVAGSKTVLLRLGAGGTGSSGTCVVGVSVVTEGFCLLVSGTVAIGVSGGSMISSLGG